MRVADFWPLNRSFSAFGGNLFCLPDPWRTPLNPPPTPSWPFVVLSGPSWTCFCLCLFALRGYLLPPTRPSAAPSRSPSNPFVALRRPSWPFVEMFLPLPFRPSWISSSPYPTLGGPLSIPLQPLRGPSSSLVALRGHVFAFAFSPFVDIFSPLPDPWRTPLNPPPTPSWPFVVLSGPSWTCFCLCLFALRGHLLPPTRPLANPSKSPSNPFVALRRS